MPRYYKPIDRKSLKRQKVWDWITLVAAVLTVIIFILELSGRVDNEQLFSLVMRVIFFTFLGYSAYRRLFLKRQTAFVDINEENISFRVSEFGHEKTETTVVDWKDIKWIKQENDFSISIFQASSFNTWFSIKEFATADQEQILTDIQATAEKKAIPLVNFSGRFVWAAG